ncbi:MAG: hypothetical protein ACJASN_000971, partial [Cyclobacteriaceae bacterium]
MNLYIKLVTKAAIAVLLTVVFSSQIKAQEEFAPGFSISGSIDAYYRVNLNSTNDSENGGILAPATSFANQPGFALGMANIIGSFEGEKVGAVVDLVFGPRGYEAVFGSAVDAYKNVNQLYAYWNVNDRLTLTLGNFNTFLGYEVISPSANFNYSTSYMFSFGPFSHSGFKADVDLGSGFSFMGAFLNPTDATDFNPSNEYVGGFQLGYSNDVGGAWLNALISDSFYQVDLTTGWDVSDKVYLGFNSTIAKDAFTGAAVYAQIGLSDAFKLGTRVEYFQDNGLGLVGLDESIIDLTISGNYTVGSLTFIPEIRF